MVAITVVLAAVLYTMVAIIIDPPDPPGTVQMSKEPDGPYSWELQITSTSSIQDLALYKVVILKDGVRVHTIDPLEENTTGDYRFTDLDGGGRLSAGDRFFITCEPASKYELNIIWRESGNTRGSVEWET
jgi:hypothetical protein